MKRKSNNSAVHAAALQDHIMRSINPKKTSRLSKLGKNIVNPTNDPIAKRQEAYLSKLSLAQRLGLVSKPDPPLDNQAWNQVEQKAAQREEHKGACPICQENFKTLPSVILSCSHVLHKQCLSSFEKYANIKCCPICRKEAYEKKNYFQTQQYYLNYCATLIQSAFKGFRQRKLYEDYLKKNPPKHPLVRRKFFSKQIGGLNQKLSGALDKREKNLEALFGELDKQLELNRQAIQAFRVHTQPDLEDTTKDWDRIKASALVRHDHDCPICLQSLTSSKENCVLSCSHVFHQSCIKAFEFFSVRSMPHCPVCRQEYSRTSYH